MIKTAEASAKTVEAAAAAARGQLGITEDEGTVEVLRLPKSGFLGIGAKDAVVRVSWELPEEKPAKQEGKKESRKAPKDGGKKAYQPAPRQTYEAGSREEKVDSFLRGLLERMDVQADIIITPREGGGLDVELAGPSMGAVIGRRGETLDAIQHLTNYALNRGGEKRMHINVDAENYRAKREDSLAKLAEKMAAKALKYNRDMALEPMNSYERHVIHTALQNYEGVTTSSVGTEPNRRVVVKVLNGEGERSSSSRRRGSSGNRSDRRSSAPREKARPEQTAAKEPEAEIVKETATEPALPADFPADYTPPVKNKPVSREWC